MRSKVAFEGVIDLFDRWLVLFAETAHDLYIAEVADQFIEKSSRIARSLQMGLYFSLSKGSNENKSM